MRVSLFVISMIILLSHIWLDEQGDTTTKRCTGVVAEEDRVGKFKKWKSTDLFIIKKKHKPNPKN